MFEATPLNTSPKSVLETTCREEFVSGHSYENVSNSNKDSVKEPIPNRNYSDFRCHEPQEEVLHSAESSSDDDSSKFDTFESPKAYESEKPFAETSHQEEPILFPAGNRATVNDDASVPELKIQNQDSSPKRKGTIFYYLFMIAYLWMILRKIGDSDRFITSILLLKSLNHWLQEESMIKTEIKSRKLNHFV